MQKLNFCVTDVCGFSFENPGISSEIFLRKWAIEYHHEDAGEIYFLTPGCKNTFRRSKNTVHLYAPGCRFREDTRKTEIPRREIYMAFTGGQNCGLDMLVEKNSRCRRFLDNERLIGGILEECALLCYERGEAAFWKVQALLTQCIFLMLDSSKQITDHAYVISGGEADADTFQRKAELYMLRHISVNIKNSDIAEAFNLSESAFIHKFKRETGVSPGTRLMEIKVEMAKGLLLKGKRLKEIAAVAGFYDEFHLSKSFKKNTGETPTEFKSRQTRIHGNMADP